MDKNLKDLKDLKQLFPDMEPFAEDEHVTEEIAPTSTLTDKDRRQMKIYVSRDKKQRAGKTVTLIEGYDDTEKAMEQMLSTLKSMCSAGGSMKEGSLIIQGDHVKKVIAHLQKQGFTQVKQKGG